MALVADTATSDSGLDGHEHLPARLPTLEPNEQAATPENAGLAPEVAAEIFNEAKDRFERAQSWYSTANSRWMEDLKFAEGDSDNQFQWPNAIRRERDIDERPCLTINKTRQHNLHIINDAKQNKPAIKVRATGNGATAESAKVLNAIIRHIEYTSNAQVAYDTALAFAVRAGKGYLRLVTDWEDAESDAQVPFIRRVNDPLTCYIDPDAKEGDKSDANFAFIFEDLPRDEFDKKYPTYKGLGGASSLDDATGWIRDDTVRIAEYFRRVEHADRVYFVPRQDGSKITLWESDLKQDPDLLVRIAATQGVKSRASARGVVEWYLLIGSKIAERSVWPGKYIPLIPVIGEETVIQGQYDCKGHTRALKDPQRMYNYFSSIAVEYSAVQTKTPFIAPAEAIEGYEVDWSNANRFNKAVLAYNALTEDGQTEIPAPTRLAPPVSMPAAIEGMQTALGEMMFASGQYQAEMGQQGNERSAKAINERQRSAENATYHFTDNLAIAIRGVGKQLLDLIPKLYDAQRVLYILADDGTSMEVQIDPNLAKAMQIERMDETQAIQRVLFNPNVGKYDVQADVGPDWGTKRAESANALTLVLTQAPQYGPIIGDLLMKCLDFDLADEAAARLRRMVPPQALGTGPSISEQQLQAQVQQLTAMLQKSMEELAKAQLKVKGKDELRDIDAYQAFTDRIKVLADAAQKEGAPVDPKDIKDLVAQVMQEAMGASLEPIMAAGAPTLEASALSGNPAPLSRSNVPPIPSARKGADGHWYVRNYAKSGNYAIVE